MPTMSWTLVLRSLVVLVMAWQADSAPTESNTEAEKRQTMPVTMPPVVGASVMNMSEADDVQKAKEMDVAHESYVKEVDQQGQGIVSHDYRRKAVLKARSGGRNKCGFARECQMCSSMDGCVWCHDDETCSEGDVYGPFSEKDDGRACVDFDSNWCPGQPCSAATVCQACKQPLCGWCRETEQCVPLNFRGEPFDTQNGMSTMCFGGVLEDCRL